MRFFRAWKSYIPVLLLGTFFVSVVSDVITVYITSFGIVASVMFLLLVGVVGLYGVVSWIRFIVVSQTNRYALITLVTMIGVLGYILSQVPLSRSLSGETGQEIVCGLSALTQPWDGFLHDCFLGYPLRQYVVLALPTYIFGPSITSLHIGVAAIFMVALIVYISGIVAYGRNTLSVVMVSVILMGLIFHSGFVSHFLFRFEQSILPFAVSMMVVGAYLQFVSTRYIVHALVMVILLSFSAQMYTPALTLIPLGIVALAVLNRQMGVWDRRYLFCSMGLLFTVCIISITYRHDIPLPYTQSPTMFQDLRSALSYLAATDVRYPYGTIILTVSMIAGLILFLGFYGWFGRMVGVWVVLVVIFSVVSKGYAWYSVDFRLHRSLVMLPVLLSSLLVVPTNLKKILDAVGEWDTRSWYICERTVLQHA